MISLLRKYSTNLALTIVGLVIIGFFFAGVSTVNAQSACPQSSFGVYVNHEVCQPAGPPPEGRDGLFICWAVGITGEINGVCNAGCCQVATYTQAPTSIFGGSLGGGFIEGVAQGVVVQTAVGFINNLISGGLGGGSYSGSGGSQYGYVDDVNTFLDITDDYGNNDNSNGFNLNFDPDNSSNNTSSNGLTYGNNDSSNNTSGGTQSGGSNTQTTQSGDSITTSYESLDRGNNSGVVNTEFGQELLDNLDNPDYTSGLSLADLERAAEEARRREALLNEQNANGEDITDYRNSAISQSGGANDSLADSYYDSLSEEEKLSWWQRFLLFISQAVGL